MNLGEVSTWVETHPGESIVIGGAAAIALLWVFGVFGGSSAAASNSGASNLASAYYAAEAQQAVVGGQIQMATIQSAAATAINGQNANAAVAIQKSQSHAATTINQQNASAGTIINSQNTQLGVAQSTDALLATYSNDAAALGTVQSNNAAATAINQSNNNASIFQTILGSLMPTELAYTKGEGAAFNIPGIGTFGGAGGIATPNDMLAAGFSPSQIATSYP